MLIYCFQHNEALAKWMLFSRQHFLLHLQTEINHITDVFQEFLKDTDQFAKVQENESVAERIS